MAKANESATIGFWLVFDLSQKDPLFVCPALIASEAVQDVKTISIKDAWNVSIQTPINSSKVAVTTMIPEIITVTNLPKKIKNYKSLWEIDEIKNKCKILATRYIEQLRSTKDL